MYAQPLRSSSPDLYHGKYAASLFASGEQGAWYDPSDLSTLFQDAAGTTPVTGVEQPVGRILDKSGRGNHATQTTTASRPVLSAKVNLFNSTTTLSSWLREGISVQTNQSGFNNSSTAVLISEQASTGRHQAIQFGMGTHTVGSSGFIYKARLKSAGTPWVLVNAGFVGQDGSPNYSDIGFFVNLFTGAIGARYGSPVLTPTVNSLGDGWWEVIVKANISGRYGVIAGLYFGSADNTLNYTGDINNGVLLDGIDIRVANESTAIPPYQRVNTATDYDTAGFPYYLAFDGVDDFLVTPSIDFTGTDKMTVFSADVSQWDNATRGIVGLSSGAFQFNGTFWLTSFDTSYSKSSVAYLRGGLNGLRGAGGYGPDQRTLGLRRLVRSVKYDLSKTTLAEEISVRLNGVSQVVNPALDPSAGDGNFGNWPLYIGRIGSGHPFNGRLYQLVVRGAQTDNAHLTHAEKYLAYKSGVTL